MRATTTVEIKPWWTSKTLWFNVAVMVVAVAEYSLGRPFSDANPVIKEVFLGTVAFGNLVLRLLTNQPLSKGSGHTPD